jgi:hypothetical protein
LGTPALDQFWIAEKNRDFLITPHPVCAAYYGLPKIHNKLSDPPLRPIVSDNDSLTEPLSQFVDFFIKNLVPSLPALLGDNNDVLNILENVKFESYDILINMDVLYTNIPHAGGLEALSHYRDQA